MTVKEGLRAGHNIQTSCRDCVFAEYDGKTQKGCKLGRINKFMERGTDVAECYDNEKEFFVVIDRYCTACRDHNWGKQHKTDIWEDLVREQIETKMEFYIIVPEGVSIEEVEYTVSQAIKNTIKPSKIHLIRHPKSSIKPSKLVSWLRNYMDGTGIQWEAHMIPLSEGTETGVIIDHAVKEKGSQFFATFLAGRDIPAHFVERVNHLLNEELERFVLMMSESDIWHGVVMQRAAYIRCGKNKLTEVNTEDGTIELTYAHEKIRQWAKSGGFEHMIRDETVVNG